MIKFESHRTHPDEFLTSLGKLGPQRLAAVKLGAYQIYPCALKQYLDAHEVRYADASGKSTKIGINHEIYLDYSVEEAMAYPRHAAAMGECDRLFPSILSQVDPQILWAAMLWLNRFIQALEELNLSSDLIDEWKALEIGREKSRTYFNDHMVMTSDEGQALKGADENWGIAKSKDAHMRIATDYAICAVLAVLTSACKNAPRGSTMKLNTLDYYKGTEIDNYISGIFKHSELLLEETLKTGSEPSSDRNAKLYNRAMKSVGFGRDSRFRVQDQQKVCSNCEKICKKKLMACARW